MKAYWVWVSLHPLAAIMGFLKMDQAYTVPRQSCITTAAAATDLRLEAGFFMMEFSRGGGKTIFIDSP
jgi:hypothetical protein